MPMVFHFAKWDVVYDRYDHSNRLAPLDVIAQARAVPDLTAFYDVPENALDANRFVGSAFMAAALETRTPLLRVRCMKLDPEPFFIAIGHDGAPTATIGRGDEAGIREYLERVGYEDDLIDALLCEARRQAEARPVPKQY